MYPNQRITTNMKILLGLAWMVILLLSAHVPVHAVTWYDKLPESGELAPKAQMGGAQPNYQGNIDFQGGVSDSPIAPSGPASGDVDRVPSSDTIASSTSASIRNSMASRSWAAGFAVVLVIIIGAIWVALIRRQHKPEK
jgi:hypothetical protein